MKITTLRKFVAPMALLALCAAGCADRDNNNQGAADSGLSPNSPDITYPKGWSELVIDANSAINKVDPAGHFHTDKNMCQRPGDGVYDITTWNTLSGALNKAASSKPLTAERCWDSPNGSKFYNKGTAELTVSRVPMGATGTTAPVISHQILFEYKNAQICTTVADSDLATALMAQIENTLVMADRADAQQCPNYQPPPSPVPGSH